MTTIGFIGSGRIGSTLARLAIAAGYDVVLSNSRGPDTLADLVAELGPRAAAATAEQAAERADIAVVTIPLKNIGQVPVAPLAGKIVIDTDNYYPQRDGQIAELDESAASSSELLQRHLPTSRVVKAFNHIQFLDLGSQGEPAGGSSRRALAIAGDDAEAKATVTELIDSFGFDTVDFGPLAESWRIHPGMPGYLIRLNRDELTAALADARRPTDS